MDDKRLRDKINNTADQELKFTKEDRNEVFEQIHKLEMKNKTQKKSLVSSSKKIRAIDSFFISGWLVYIFVYAIDSFWKL